jgi:hypothetical protein
MIAENQAKRGKEFAAIVSLRQDKDIARYVGLVIANSVFDPHTSLCCYSNCEVTDWLLYCSSLIGAY